MKETANSGHTSPPTEVSAKTTRRRFSAKYKKRILDEAAACAARGEIGALLRREGLYSSHLAKWGQQEKKGALAGLAPKKRGPTPRAVDARDKQLADTERALRKMTRRAERAEALVELQKKVSERMGMALPTSDDES
ncbi:MAG: transposase [Myxococcota bacterium]